MVTFQKAISDINTPYHLRETLKCFSFQRSLDRTYEKTSITCGTLKARIPNDNNVTYCIFIRARMWLIRKGEYYTSPRISQQIEGNYSGLAEDPTAATQRKQWSAQTYTTYGHYPGKRVRDPGPRCIQRFHVSYIWELTGGYNYFTM